MATERQPSLFDDLPRPGDALVQVAGSQRALTAEQRRFNKLVVDIQREREALENWTAAIDTLRRRVSAELVPAQQQLYVQQVRLARALDALFLDPAVKLSRRHRAALSDAVVDLLEAAFEHGGDDDPELVAVFDRHSPITLAEDRRLEVDMAKGMFEGLLDDDLDLGGDPADLDELLSKAGARMTERQQEQQQRREREAEERARRRAAAGKGPTKAESAAAAREQATKAMGQTVREVFRQLASSLHPDRAADDQDRDRRHALMQRANQAYTQDDLLALLTLQIEIEQIDALHVAELPDQKVAHFNAVLREQLQALKQQVQDLRCSFSHAPPAWRRLPTMDELAHGLQRDIAETHRCCESAEADLAALADPKQRLALLDRLADEHRPSEGDQPMDMVHVLMALAQGAPMPGAEGRMPARARKSKPRRR